MKRFKVLAKLEIKRYMKALPWMVMAAAMMALIVSAIGITGNTMLNVTSVDSVEGLIDDMTSGKGNLPEGENREDKENGAENDGNGGGNKENGAENEENGGENKENGGENKEDGNGADSRIAVAMVIQDKSKTIKLAKSIINNIDSVTSLINIKYVDEEEGERLLDNHEVVVMLIVREKTVAGIMNGENIPVEVRFPKNSGYEAAIFKEFADAAVGMLSTSQAAIYSVYDFYREYGHYSKKNDALDRLNMATIMAVLERENTFKEKEVVVTGELSVMEYYVCGGMILFVMFFSIMLVQYLGRQSRDISARLEMSGTGYLMQVCAAFAGAVSIYGVLILLAGIAASLVKVILGNNGFMADISYGQICGMAVLMIPAAFTASAFALMVCRFTEHALAQILILFLAAVLQGFITGCFVPKLLLPEVLAGAELFLPAHYMIESVSGVFLGSVSPAGILGMIFFTLAFLGITVFIESNSAEKRRGQ